MAAESSNTKRRWVYVLRLRPAPGIDELRAVRAALKTLWRRHRLICIRITREARHDP